MTEDHLTVTGDGAVQINDEEIPPERAEWAAMKSLRMRNGHSILLDAYETGRRRGKQYGPPDENFEQAAVLMGAYLGLDLNGLDYAMLMIQAKMARLQTGGVDREHLLDIAGYARAAAEYAGVNNR